MPTAAIHRDIAHAIHASVYSSVHSCVLQLYTVYNIWLQLTSKALVSPCRGNLSLVAGKALNRLYNVLINHKWPIPGLSAMMLRCRYLEQDLHALRRHFQKNAMESRDSG